MNCSEFQHVCHELVRDRVEGREKIEALAHAGECSRCAEYMEDERRLTLKLAFLSQIVQKHEAPASLENVLVSAFRENAAEARDNGGVPLHAGPRYWAYQKFWLLGAGAAALAAVIVLMVVLQAGRHSAPQLSSSAAPATASQEPALTSAPSAGEQGTEPQAVVQATRRIHAATSPARANDGQETVVADASGYVPLVYCDEINCGTPGDVVRVELPASSLPMMGLVSDNRTGPVRADVVIGEDGIARAIRLVDY